MMQSVKKLIPKKLKSIVGAQVRKYFYQNVQPSSFAQCGEDLIIKFMFERLDKRVSSYLDVGACHPKFGNNTYLFYLKGARGICVEPNPAMQEMFRMHRPEDRLLTCGVTDSHPGSAQYFSFRNPQLNTFDESEAVMRRISDPSGYMGVEKVETMLLSVILREHFPNGLDLLSIDVEGLDERILESSSFEEVRPICICVESVNFVGGATRNKSLSLNKLMAEKGYEVYADSFVNTIFISSHLFSQLRF